MITKFPGYNSRWRLAARMMLVGMALGAPTLSQAAVVIPCIDDVSQVKTVLDAALASANTTEEVRIKSGNYFFTTGDIGYFGVLQGTGKSLSIRGGWSGAPGQCTTQDGNSTSTVFWGNDARRVFAINASTTFTGTITIENMAFGGGFSDSISSTACLSLGEQNGGVMGIRLDRVWVEGCATTSDFNNAVVTLSTHSVLLVRNSAFVNNNSGISVPVSFAVRNSVGFVLNNTIANNTSAEANGYAGLFVSASDGATLTLGNNLFDGNVNTTAARVDLRVAGSGTSLQNNRFTGLSGTPDANTGSSTGSADFSSPGGYQLGAASTARDAGIFFAPAFQGTVDAAGEVRVQGSAVDLGALEYPLLFKNGFESP